MVVLGVYRYGASFVPKFKGKFLKMVGSNGPLCAQMVVKSSLGTVF